MTQNNFKHEMANMQSIESIQSDTTAQNQQSSKAQQLMMKILMLSIELDRKDVIVRELSEAEEYKQKYQTIMIQFRSISEKNQALQANLHILEKTHSQSQLRKSKIQSEYQIELQNKLEYMQTKLKNALQENIYFQNDIKNCKVQNSMLTVKITQLQSNDKVYTLQNQINKISSMLIEERKINEEKQSIIDRERRANEEKQAIINRERRVSEERQNVLNKAQNQIRSLREEAENIRTSYEQRIRRIHEEARTTNEMKKSQIMASEEKIVLTVQQLNRLKEEVDYLRGQLKQLDHTSQTKQKQIISLRSQHQSQSRANQQSLQYSQQQASHFESSLRAAKMDLQRECEKNAKLEAKLQKLREEYEENIIIYRQSEIERATQTSQESKLRVKINELELQLDQLKSTIRKLKRKKALQECEGCRIVRPSNGKMRRGINNLSLAIEETQKLKDSNRKVDSLLERHESILESSFNMHNINWH